MADSARQELQRLHSEHAAALAENKNLHTLIEQLTKQIEESTKANEELRKILLDLQAKLDTLVVQQKKRNRRDYGKKTERYNPRPAQAVEGSDTIAAPVRIKDNDRIALMEKLPVKPVPHKVPDNERNCPDCGVERIFIGEDITYQLDRITSTIRRLRHVQEKLSCPNCKGNVVVAKKPEPPFPRCTTTAGMLSDVIISKWADYSTTYRLSRIYSRQGAPIPRSTLCDWILAASLTLEPLYDLLVKRVFQSKVIRTDDTEVKIQDRKTGKNIRKGKMTPYIGDKNNRYNIFDFSPNQSFDRNKAMLANFKGFVQCDAAIGFDAVFETGNCTEVGCNAHGRRKFFECLEISPEKSRQVLDIYNDIFEVDRRAKENGVPPEVLLEMRQTESKPLFELLRTKLLEIQITELPKSPFSKAINYILSHWIAMTRYLDDPDLAMDNNCTEQAVKEFVLCRKNALFVGSDAGGKAAAICLSILSSAKRNGVEPSSYLTDIFTRINAARTNELEQFLPDIWLKSQVPNS